MRGLSVNTSKKILLRKFVFEIIGIIKLLSSIVIANWMVIATVSPKNPFLRRKFRKKLPDGPIFAPLKTKIVALYLPQFHEIHENNLFWGSGFTEWTNVKKAKPNFFGHYQPHIPKGKNYYDLSDVSVMEQQMQLAKKFGIDAFGIYYYLFDGKPILEKPIGNILNSPNIDFPFFLIWANENWTRTWDGMDQEILLKQSYQEGWENQLVDALTPFLKDKRYFQFKGKALVGIYLPSAIPKLAESILLIRNLVRDSLGIEIFLLGSTSHQKSFSCAESGIDAKYIFAPNVPTSKQNTGLLFKISNCQKPGFAKNYTDFIVNSRNKNNIYMNETFFNGVFPSWDNTPRRGPRFRVVRGSSPRLFEYWLNRELMISARNKTITEDLLFINAWNEWGEGCHLEPDEKFGYKWLWAVRNSKKNVYKKYCEM